MPETIFACLATAALGGIWSSCSPDFGVNGILDRFGQIGPKVLIACDGYYYNGRTFDIGDKLAEVVDRLPELEAVILIDYIGKAGEIAARIRKAHTLDAFMAPHAHRRHRLCPASLRPPALHPVLVGHHRRAEVHRAPRRRRAAQAPVRTAAALRPQARPTACSTSPPAAG
jgi:hypothetical protein